LIAAVPSPSAVANTIRAPQTCFWGAVAVVGDHLQALAIGRVQVDGDASAHPEDSHAG